MRSFPWTLVGVAGLAAAALAAPGGTVVFETSTPEDFGKGELEGVVVTGAGRVQPGAPLTTIDLGGAAVMAMAAGADGTLWAATGRPAELHAIQNGTARRVLAGGADDVAFTCCAVDAAGMVTVGAFPTGKVYRVRAGADPAVVTLPDPYVWALALDGGGACYAATGPEGKVYRVAPGGDVSVVADTEEKNVVSLLLEADGALLFGTAEKGLLYRRDAAGAVTVLQDFPEREVRALVRAGRRLWVGTNAPQKEFSQKEFAESLATTLGKQDADSGAPAGERGAALKKLLKGAVWQVGDDGRAEQVFALAQNYLLAMAPDGTGGCYVACGAEGRVFRVVPAAVGHDAHVVFDLREGQVLALAAKGDRLAGVGCGGPGRCFAVGAVAGGGTYVSPVHDVGVAARLGTCTWNGKGAVTVELRQGHTAEPDASWSPWRAPDAGAVAGPRARYVQFRLRFGDDPEAFIDRVTLTYLPDNRRPTIKEVKVGKKGRGPQWTPGDVEPERPLKIQFKAEDPDGDTVAVRCFVRDERRPDEWVCLTPDPIEKAPYDWDVANMADGTYRLRLVATDAPGNTPERALEAAWESRPILVDNTPPLVADLRLVRGASGPEVRGRAVDAASAIVRLEVALGTGPWQNLLPDDQNLDGADERFTWALPAGSAEKQVVRLRVTDATGNVRVVQETLAAG